MDLDAIFDGKDPLIEQAAPPAEAPPPAPEPVQQAEPEPAAAAPPEPAPEPPQQDRNVPLAAMLDERDKRKAAERRLADYEAAQAARQPAAVPDPYDDPQGFQAHVAQQTANQALSLRFDLSESMAREKHGEEAVTAAMEWGAQRAAANAGFRDEFLGQKNPIDWVVRQQKRDVALADVGDDPDAYVRRRAAELGFTLTDAGAGTTPAPGQPQAPKPAAPPRSIASAASAGGNHRDVATGPLSAIGAVFSG